MLKKIKVEGLFNRFNYEIDLKKEGITILTGPNGYGKTTILKIIYAFSVKNLSFFFQLPFARIIFLQDEDEIILVKKDEDMIEIKSGKKSLPFKRSDFMKDIKRFLEENPYYRQIDKNRWIDRRTDSVYTAEALINQLIETDPLIQDRIQKQPPDLIDVYLIREQRLIRQAQANRRRNSPSYYYEDVIQESFSSTIKEYALELSKELKDILASASKVGQELDSSFPRRLFDETRQVGEKEFNHRYNLIKEKQISLSMYGLSASKEDSQTSFKKENAKALLVYLDDTENKLKIFDGILQKLEIFSTVLNERQFVFKRLDISPDFGFRFITEGGKELSLTDLSSGEQQEVVLLYELLFKVKPNTLVLIDEPEISLHVAWQKEVLNDLLKIIEVQRIAVITATHSPQIIGSNWDLVVDLEEISR